MTAPFQPEEGRELHPQLASLVRAAREQPEPVVSVRFEDVQRAASRRWHRSAIALALAAGLAGVVVWAMRADDTEHTDQVQVAAVEPTHTQPEAGERRTLAEPGGDTPESTATVALASNASLEVLAEGTPRPSIVDGIPVDLVPGRYAVRTSEDALEVPLRARVLEVQAASEVVLDVTLEHITFEVVRGRASWKTPEPGGDRDDEPGASKPRPSAKQLQAQAEAALIRGDRSQAIVALRSLVKMHPRSTAAKAGLIDLARLEKAAGRVGRARCAYALFLRRFPSDARAPSVRTAAEPLGPAHCRDLEPRSR